MKKDAGRLFADAFGVAAVVDRHSLDLIGEDLREVAGVEFSVDIDLQTVCGIAAD